MMIMFQYRGNAYTFDMIDESLLDIEEVIKWINAGKCPSLPMTPDEVSAFLRLRKKDPRVGEGKPA